MAKFTEKQQRELREAVQHLAQSKHHLSMAISGIEQAMELLKPFKQNLSAFQTMTTHLNTFLTKLSQAHESIEQSLPKQTRQPKIIINERDAQLNTPWLTPIRLLWIVVGLLSTSLIIWFARYVSTGMYGR